MQYLLLFWNLATVIAGVEDVVMELRHKNVAKARLGAALHTYTW